MDASVLDSISIARTSTVMKVEVKMPEEFRVEKAGFVLTTVKIGYNI